VLTLVSTPEGVVLDAPLDPAEEGYFIDFANDLFFFPISSDSGALGTFRNAGKVIRLGRAELDVGSMVSAVYIPDDPFPLIPILPTVEGTPFGAFNIQLDEFESVCQYTDILPFMDTPMGRFTDVLRVEMFMRIKYEFFGSTVNSVVKQKTLFLKE